MNFWIILKEAFRNANASRGNRRISLAVTFVDIHVIKRQTKKTMIIIASPASKNYSELRKKVFLNWTKIILSPNKTTGNKLRQKYSNRATKTSGEASQIRRLGSQLENCYSASNFHKEIKSKYSSASQSKPLRNYQ